MHRWSTEFAICIFRVLVWQPFGWVSGMGWGMAPHPVLGVLEVGVKSGTLTDAERAEWVVPFFFTSLSRKNYQKGQMTNTLYPQ